MFLHFLHAQMAFIVNVTFRKDWLKSNGSPQSYISDCKFKNEKEISNLEFKEFAIICGKGD